MSVSLPFYITVRVVSLSVVCGHTRPTSAVVVQDAMKAGIDGKRDVKRTPSSPRVELDVSYCRDIVISLI